MLRDVRVVKLSFLFPKANGSTPPSNNGFFLFLLLHDVLKQNLLLGERKGLTEVARVDLVVVVVVVMTRADTL